MDGDEDQPGSSKRPQRNSSKGQFRSIRKKAPGPTFTREGLPHTEVESSKSTNNDEPQFQDADDVSIGKPQGRGRWADQMKSHGHNERSGHSDGASSPREENYSSNRLFPSTSNGRGGYERGTPRSRTGTDSNSSALSSLRVPPWKSREEREHRQRRSETVDAELDGNIPNSFQISRNPAGAPSTFLKRTTKTDAPEELFSSPPLMPGLLSCLRVVLGPNAKPTPIQALSMKNILNMDPRKYAEALLASETGSGKSIAYMLPLLQALKQMEIDGNLQRQMTHAINPRALILAPSHELARQLTTFAKSLIHEIKLRIMCSSRANVNNKMDVMGGSPSQMKQKLEALFTGETLDIRSEGRYPVDVLVGTPMKLLDIAKGKGWDRRLDEEKEKEKEKKEQVDEDADEETRRHKYRKGRDISGAQVGATGKYPAELGLINVEWVIIDEADVLFDPDFQESTRLLLSEIATARGQPVPYHPDTFNYRKHDNPIEPLPVKFPFNLVLTSATIPSALSNYLEIHHPSHLRLASPKLHHLPTNLQKEYVNWSGGNKLADIEKRIRRVWSEDSISHNGQLSKVLVFCNKKTKVGALHQHLEEKGIKSVAIDGSPESRGMGSNRHLNGFLRKPRDFELEDKKAAEKEDQSDPAQTPHVLITTSLLSRGIDFSPDIKHVFIVDEPRNMTDFIHRAGRSARAGNKGKVVIFGKLEGRGSGRAKEVRRQVAALS